MEALLGFLLLLAACWIYRTGKSDERTRLIREELREMRRRRYEGLGGNSQS